MLNRYELRRRGQPRENEGKKKATGPSTETTEFAAVCKGEVWWMWWDKDRIAESEGGRGKDGNNGSDTYAKPRREDKDPEYASTRVLPPTPRAGGGFSSAGVRDGRKEPTVASRISQTGQEGRFEAVERGFPSPPVRWWRTRTTRLPDEEMFHPIMSTARQRCDRTCRPQPPGRGLSDC